MVFELGLHLPQPLQVFELGLHLPQPPLQLPVLLRQSLQLLLCKVLLALLLLSVPEGGRPVLGLLPLLLVGRVGSDGGRGGRLGPGVFLPGPLSPAQLSLLSRRPEQSEA